MIPADCYQGVAGIAAEGAAAGRWKVETLATDDTSGWIEAAARADLLWVESPSNPMMVVGDLVAIGAAERRPGCLLAVDNTFATPLNQRPLDLGADLSVQSGTKFLGGHSDLLSGVVSTRNEALLAGLRKHRLVHGATPGALESFLALRGLRTLAVRLDRSQATPTSWLLGSTATLPWNGSAIPVFGPIRAIPSPPPSWTGSVRC